RATARAAPPGNPLKIAYPTTGEPLPRMGAGLALWAPKPPDQSKFELLDLDLCARVFQLLLELGSLFLGNGFLEGLGCTLDHVLGFLEAQASDLTHDLDHVDLLSASIGEDHIELGLLFGGLGGRTGDCGTSHCNGCSAHAPLLLELLHQ